MTSLTVNPDYKLIGNNIKQMRTILLVFFFCLVLVFFILFFFLSQHLKCSLDELIFGTDKKSYPAAGKPLSDHTVDECNQLLKRSLAEMMFQCLQHPEGKLAK